VGTDLGVVDVAFPKGYALSESAEIALEDYARVLAQAEGSEALHQDEPPALVTGVRLRAAGLRLTDELRRDIEGFARGLAQDREGGGLGWS
jgi:hypothetical protein